MNTFWGCNTETMTDLSGDFGTGAERLQGVIAHAVQARRTVTWFGPDAEEHRSLTEEMLERAEQIVEVIRRLSELLGKEATAQDICSVAEGGSDPTDPLRVRAELPSLDDWGLPRLRGAREEEWRPTIAGPLQSEEPFTPPDFGDLRPYIGGPMMREPDYGEPNSPFPTRAPVAPDAKYPLEPGYLENAESIRRLALRAVPGGGIAQGLMDAHDAIGTGFDGAESLLEKNGLGSFTPLVDAARIPHTLTEPMLGESSVAGQVVSGVDRSIANTLQTTDEVAVALGDGDLAEAARAVERGHYRNAEASLDILTATPYPSAAQSASDVLGTGGDLVDAVSPGAGEPLHAASEVFQGAHDDLQGGLDTLTDSEAVYDLRRQHLPMPWDEKA